MTRSIALAALALLPVCSCFTNTYEVAETEVLVRYVPEQDELLILEIEHGIEEGGKSPDPRRIAADALHGIADGKKIYPGSGEWLAVDFDELAKRAQDPADTSATAAEKSDLLEFVKTIHVEDRGLYVDEEHGLSLFRLTRLGHFRRVIEITNDFLNRSFRKDGAKMLPTEPEFPLFDEASRELFRSAVNKGHSWLSIQDGGVVLDVPMTSASAARCLAWLLREASEEEERADELRVYRQASSLEVADGHVRLKFGGEDKPVVRFTYHSKNAGSSADLIELLRADRVALGKADAPDAALAKLRGAPAQIRSK